MLSAQLDQKFKQCFLEPILHELQAKKYIELKLRDSSALPKPEQELIKAWLNSEPFISQCLLLHGLPGSGKTLLAMRLVKALWKKGYIACYLSLATYNNTSNFLAKLRKDCLLTEEELNEFKKQKLLFIFDDYHLLHAKQSENCYEQLNFFQQQGLADFSNLRVIYTCDSHFLERHRYYKALFRPCNLGGKQAEELIEYELCSLDNDQLVAFGELYDQEDIQSQLQDLFSAEKALKELARNPRVLSLLVSLINTLISFENQKPWLLSDIYHGFVETCVTNHIAKICNEYNIDAERPVSDYIIDNVCLTCKDETVAECLKNIVIDSITVIARHLKSTSQHVLKPTNGELNNSTLSQKVVNEVLLGQEHKVFLTLRNESAAKVSIRYRDLITVGDLSIVKQNSYEFSNSPMLNYLAARAAFLRTAEENIDRLSYYLNTRLLVDEVELLQHLSTQVQHEQALKKKLFNIILRSREDVTVTTAAANAITILNRAGISFANMDLSGISIEGADLTGAMMHNTNLSRANMQKVRISRAWLNGADFKDALLDNTELDEATELSLDGFTDFYCTAMSPNGRKAAAAYAEKLKIYVGKDLNTDLAGQALDCLTYSYEFKNSVVFVSFNQFGDELVIGTYAGEVHIWSLKQNSQKPELRQLASAHKDSIIAACLVNNIYLFTADKQKKLIIWQKDKTTYQNGTSLILPSASTIIIAGKNQQVFVGLEDGQVISYSYGTTQKQFSQKKLFSCGKKMSCLTLINDKNLIIGYADGQIEIWTLQEEQWQIRQTFDTHAGTVHSLNRCDDSRFISAGRDNRIYVWNLATSEPLQPEYTLFCQDNNKSSHIITPDTQDEVLIASFECNSHQAKLIFRHQPTYKISNQNHLLTINCLALLANGKYLVSGAADGMVKLWQIDTLACLNSWNCMPLPGRWLNQIQQLCLTPGFNSEQGSIFVAVSDDSIRKIDCQLREEVVIYQANYIMNIIGLKCSVDGDYLAVLNKDRLLLFHRKSNSFKLIYQRLDWYSAVEFSQVHKALVVLARNGSLQFINLQTLTFERVLFTDITSSTEPRALVVRDNYFIITTSDNCLSIFEYSLQHGMQKKLGIFLSPFFCNIFLALLRSLPLQSIFQYSQQYGMQKKLGIFLPSFFCNIFLVLLRSLPLQSIDQVADYWIGVIIKYSAIINKSAMPLALSHFNWAIQGQSVSLFCAYQQTILRWDLSQALNGSDILQLAKHSGLKEIMIQGANISQVTGLSQNRHALFINRGAIGSPHVHSAQKILDRASYSIKTTSIQSAILNHKTVNAGKGVLTVAVNVKGHAFMLLEFIDKNGYQILRYDFRLDPTRPVNYLLGAVTCGTGLVTINLISRDKLIALLNPNNQNHDEELIINKQAWDILNDKINELRTNVAADRNEVIGYNYLGGTTLVNFFKPSIMEQHNCYTWCTKHLKAIGIEINESSLIANPATDIKSLRRK